METSHILTENPTISKMIRTEWVVDVLNGQLVSVPETLYDGFIEKEIAAEGEVFREANVVGKVLGKYQLGIGDAWVAHRIEEMIRRGELEPASEAPKDSPIFHRMLKKCT